MMSYLWILLLGSLLAASAKAQDEVGPDEEAAPLTPAPEADVAVEVIENLDADEGSDPQPTTEPEAEDTEAVALAEEDTEAVAPADEDTEAVAPADEDTEAEVPADEDTEAEAPADEDTEAVAPADEDAEATAIAVVDPEATAIAVVDAEATAIAVVDAEATAIAVEDEEATAIAVEDEEAVTPAAGDAEPATPAAPTEVPTANPEAEDPKDEQPTANGEEETTLTAGAAPAEEEDGDMAGAATDLAAADNKEEPTDPATDIKPTDQVIPKEIVPEVRINVNAAIPADKEVNLDDAQKRAEGIAVDNPGQSRTGPHISGATGDDSPDGQESGSGSLAAILCTVGAALVAAVAGYITYQKKKLCFKNRQEADPEAARKADAAEAQSDPQVLSNLLNSS
ncbi:serine-aspartate repeat-containing protein I [Pempheris klunzingeri]|uniref:serine-aspartate repeat-containing protein I n=1 Tax=Pempheris klunzingeri TaxID=3127111 RepID=UPI0039808EB2